MRYTDKSYYFVNVSGGFGKRIQTMMQPETSPDISITEFQDYQFHEVDEFNIAKVGRRWFGDRFDIENEKEFEFSFPNLITTEPARVKIYAAAISDSQTSMQVKLNGTVIDVNGIEAGNDFQFQVVDSPTLAILVEVLMETFLWLSSPDVTFNLNYDNNGNPSSSAYLDYISIEATRALTFEGDQFIFKNDEVATVSEVAEYTISNASSISQVWDITDKYNVKSDCSKFGSRF